MSPSVIAVVNGPNNVTTADPTITLSTSPTAGDVLIVAAIQGTSLGGGSDPTAVSGAGATWTKVIFTKAISFGTVWIGTGATATGTITVTANAQGTGRALQLYHLRGVAPYVTAYGGNDEKISKLGDTNQVVIAIGNGSATTNSLADASFYPAVGSWTKSANIEMTTGSRNVIGAYILPSGAGAFYSESDRELFMLAIGTPASVITRHNLIAKPGFGDGNTNNYGWANVTGQTIDATIYHSWPYAIRATASAANAEFSMYSGTTGAAVSLGGTYTWSVWVRSDHARTAYVGVSYSGGTPSTWGTPTAIPANTWTRVSKTEVAGASGTVGRMTVRFTDTASGDLIWADDYMCEAGSVLGDYFDGSTYDTARQSYWDGSTNTSTATQLSYGTPDNYGLTNFITNPDAEVDTTGWTGTAGTLTRSTSRWVNGTAGFQLVCTNPSAAQACMIGTTVTGLTVGATYTLSGFVQRFSGTTNLQLFVNDGSYHYNTATIFSGQWEHTALTFVAAASSVTVGVTNAQAIATATSFTCDTMTLVAGTSDEPFSPFTPARAGVTFKPVGAVGGSETVKGTGRVNLFKNPAFEDGTKWGWNGTVDAGSTVIDATNGLFGPYCLKSTCTGTFHRIRGTNGAGNQAEMIPITPGKRYTVTCYVKSVGGGSSFQLIPWGANAAGTTTAQYNNGGYSATSTTAWTRFKVSFTAVAGDAYAWIQLDFLGTNGYFFYFDGFLFEETGGGTDLDKVPDYFDGSTATEDWVTNTWTGTANASTSLQVPNPSWVKPQVIAIHDSAISTTTTTTVTVTATPAAGDVLLLLSWWSSVATYPPPTAVSGCGAVWTQVDGGSDNVVAWVGTGATSSGTVTLTHTAVTARAARIYHTRGTSADALFLKPDNTYHVMANPNQIAIGLAGHTTGSVSSLVGGSRIPYYGWTNSPDFFMTASRMAMSAHLFPTHRRDIKHFGNTYGGVLILGSPVQAYTVGRRNPLRNSNFESTAAWNSTIIPTTSVATPVYSGIKAFGGTASGSGAAVISQSTALGNYAAIKGGGTYTASIYVYCNQAGRTANVRLAWKTTGVQALTTEAWSSPVTLTQNAWTRVTGTFTAPADARYAELDTQITLTNADLAYIDAAQIDVGAVALPYFDGSTTPAAGELNRYTGQGDWGTRSDWQYESLALTPVPAPPTGPVIKVREAGAWVVKTPVAKARVAGAWVVKPLRYWNGAAWVDLF